MCLATPVEVKKLTRDKAVVDALGKDLAVNISLLDGINVGDYLLVKGELAIQKLSGEEAQEILELIKDCDHQHE